MARQSRTRLAATDSLSNLAASLGTGKDKAATDSFFVADLARDQIEAMYRGDWLARKVVDIVPYDSIRAWREWQGEPAAVAAVGRIEQRLGLRKAVQRAMVLGRLYGGGAIIIGTRESDAAALARPLHPEAVGTGDVAFLQVVSRWQLGTVAINTDPLDPYFGEPAAYTLASPERGELVLHPSRVVRFLGQPLPDPLLYGAQAWSDSVLQGLYDAIHAVAVTGAGATSLVHEAKVDIVTVPNLSEHLSNAATTAQLSARFGYAAAMKSINNLLLLGDGESWSRQSVDFAGLPEMVRTFLQVAAGAADIPVTRLLGQSPAGLSATGDSDTRNYYDMIAARQELDLRPPLERLDAVVLRSAGVDPEGLRFSFRPLWQLSATEKAAVSLQRAQATAVYAGLQLWPTAVTVALARSQLLEDGTYPAAAAFAAGEGDGSEAAASPLVTDAFNENQPRDDWGRWTSGGAGVGAFSLPGSAAIPANVGFAPPQGPAVRVAGDEEDLEREERRAERAEREKIDLNTGLKARPDGSLEPPKMPLELHRGQQDKHIPGTNNFDPLRSVLEHPDPQGLLNRGAGTGTSANGLPAGQPGARERVDFGERIGQFKDTEGLITSTTKGINHYSKRGAHIVPSKP